MHAFSSKFAPEQHDVSRRRAAGGNECPQRRQSHVDFEGVITVALPGTLAQHCRRVHAWGHHVADARAVIKHLEGQMTGTCTYVRERRVALETV